MSRAPGSSVMPLEAAAGIWGGSSNAPGLAASAGLVAGGGVTDEPGALRVAAGPDVEPRLDVVRAADLFFAAGFEAVAGFPLPSGDLPVATLTLGIVMVPMEEWDLYVALCCAERPCLPLPLGR